MLEKKKENAAKAGRKFSAAALLAVATVMGASASNARAIDLIGNLVTTYNGPTYSIGTGQFTLTATPTDFAVTMAGDANVNLPAGGTSPGQLNLNIALSDANDLDPAQKSSGNFNAKTGDFLSLQVAVNAGNTFDSNMAIDYGSFPVSVSQTEYWFAFYSAGTASSPESRLIGGYLSKFSNGRTTDVKVFDTANPAPLPSSAIGGGLLMSALAGWMWVRRNNLRKAGLA